MYWVKGIEAVCDATAGQRPDFPWHLVSLFLFLCCLWVALESFEAESGAFSSYRCNPCVTEEVVDVVLRWEEGVFCSSVIGASPEWERPPPQVG